MKNNDFHFNISKPLFLSLSFSIIFVLIPWQNILSKIYFTDRLTYQYMVESGFNKILVGDYFDSFYSYLTYEWLWEYILYITFERMSISFATIFLFITFFNVLMSSYLVSKYSKSLYLIFLLNPWYFDFLYSQSRLCFAVSLIFLSFILRKYKLLSILIVFSTFFIHTSAVLFSSICLFVYFVYKNIFSDQKLFKFFFVFIVAVLISFLTGSFLINILSSLGDRRTENYGDIDFNVGVVNMLPWLLFYLIFVYKISKFNLCDEYYNYLAFFFLTLVIFSSFVFGGYAIRYLVVGYPIILISFSNILRSKEKSLFFFTYFFYMFLLWFFRLFIVEG